MKKILIALGTLVALSVAYVAAGPYLALNGIRDGIVDQDVEALAEHIDFPILRENVKAQMNAYMMTQMQKTAGESDMAAGFAAMGMMFAGKMIDGMIDNLMTPAGISALTRPKGGASDEASRENVMADVDIDYSGFSRATVTPQNNPDLKLILSRQGWSWRLTNILFPMDQLKNSAPE